MPKPLPDSTYKQCSRCVLDNHDYPDIVFDENGVCDMCHNYDALAKQTIVNGEEGRRKVERLIREIQENGKNNKYDCLLGVSGGVDSSYMAYLCKQWGLRPLIVHVDNGWNTELAVDNIDRLLTKLGFELHTEVLNWPQMRDLQLAFIKANVIDIDLPTDNAYHASLYKTASKLNIKYILTGHNTVTEGNLPPNFNHFKLDTIQLKDIHKKFGTLDIKGFPLIGPANIIYYHSIKNIRTISPLNWIEYNKTKVKEFLAQEFGWRDYGGKHYENIFTRFYQGYILPTKFGIDKRKAHLSTLICSGQITKKDAINEISSTPYIDMEQLEFDKEYFIKKLKMSNKEFSDYIKRPPTSHRSYKSILDYYELLRPVKRLFKKVLNLK